MSSSPEFPHSEASQQKKKQKLEKSSSELPPKEKHKSKTLDDEENSCKMSDNGDSHVGIDSLLDDQHKMTDAKLKQKSAAATVGASARSDVPSSPGVPAFASGIMITPLDLNDNRTLLQLLPVCLAAIDYLYKTKHAKLELLILEKVNTHVANGISYYNISFEAYNPVTDTSRTLTIALNGEILKKKRMNYPNPPLRTQG